MRATYVQEDIRKALGFPTTNDALGATEVVLTAVGRRLSDLAARSLAIELPPAWAKALTRQTDQLEPGPLDPLIIEVARTLGVPEGEALEVTQVVCQKLGEHLSSDARHALDAAFPPAWAALFAPGETARALSPAPAAGVPPQTRSVAEGRRAPSNKLSDGTPRTASLADGRVDEGETLAEGRAGSHQPLSTGRPS
jgi:uncharacterized protein (DUF2267 family)